MKIQRTEKANVIAQPTEDLTIVEVASLGICVVIGTNVVIRCSDDSAAYQLVADLTSEDYEILIPTTASGV